jgi:hypothetical protein
MAFENKRTVRLGLEDLEAREVPASLNYTYQNQSNGAAAALRTDQSVARSDTGWSVAVWKQSGGIYARVFRPGGSMTNPIPVATAGWGSTPTDPSVDMAPDGRFVVAWTYSAGAGSSGFVVAQRFDPTGHAYGDRIWIDDPTSTPEEHPDVAMDARDNFVVAYEFDASTSNHDIYVQQFQWSGYSLPPKSVAASQSLTETEPSIAMNASGQFVVAWQVPALQSVWARSYAKDGTPTPVSGVHIAGGGGVIASDPSVGIDGNGNYVVAYTSLDTYQGSSATKVCAQPVDVHGNKQNLISIEDVFGYPFPVWSSPASTPSVDMAPDGRFVIAYQSNFLGSNTDIDVFVRQYDSTGHLLGGGPVVVANTTSWEGAPSVAMDSSGNFTVLYQTGASSAPGRINSKLYTW